MDDITGPIPAPTPYAKAHLRMLEIKRRFNVVRRRNRLYREAHREGERALSQIDIDLGQCDLWRT